METLTFMWLRGPHGLLGKQPTCWFSAALSAQTWHSPSECQDRAALAVVFGFPVSRVLRLILLLSPVKLPGHKNVFRVQYVDPSLAHCPLVLPSSPFLDGLWFILEEWRGTYMEIYSPGIGPIEKCWKNRRKAISRIIDRTHTYEIVRKQFPFSFSLTTIWQLPESLTLLDDT